MNLEQIGLQLGMAGLIIVVFYKLAVQFIDRWSANDLERTKSVAAGFAGVAQSVATGFSELSRSLDSHVVDLTQRLGTHAAADQEAHLRIVDRVSRFEGKLDEVIAWQERTPVGFQEPRPPSPAGTPPPKPHPASPPALPYSVHKRKIT